MVATQPSLPTYAIEVVPAAWRQLGHLSQEDYGVLQARLAVLVKLAAQGQLPGSVPEHEGVDTALSFTVGDFVLRYEVDPSRSAIRLTEVTLRLPALPTGVGGR